MSERALIAGITGQDSSRRMERFGYSREALQAIFPAGPPSTNLSFAQLEGQIRENGLILTLLESDVGHFSGLTLAG